MKTIFAKKDLEAFVFLLPALILCSIFLLYPIYRTAYLSLHQYNGIKSPTFIGIENYKEAFTNEFFLNAAKRSILWLICILIIPVSLGLLLAVILNNAYGEGVLKLVFFFPYVLSGVVISNLWYYMVTTYHGVIPTLLGLVGIKSPRFLMDVPANTFTLVGISIWQLTGFFMMIFSTGLKTIPPEPLESAMIDGASKWQTFWHVTFPLLSPITTVAMAMAVITALQVFDVIFVLTQGGPYYTSETLTVTVFREAFRLYHIGYACALSIILCLLTTGVVVFYVRRMTRIGKGVEA